MEHLDRDVLMEIFVRTNTDAFVASLSTCKVMWRSCITLKRNENWWSVIHQRLYSFLNRMRTLRIVSLFTNRFWTNNGWDKAIAAFVSKYPAVNLFVEYLIPQYVQKATKCTTWPSCMGTDSAGHLIYNLMLPASCTILQLYEYVRYMEKDRIPSTFVLCIILLYTSINITAITITTITDLPSPSASSPSPPSLLSHTITISQSIHLHCKYISFMLKQTCPNQDGH